MTTQVRRILVAVRDLHHPPRTELRKAIELARATGAAVELFHAVEVSVRNDQTANALAARAQRSIRTAEDRLQKLSRQAPFGDIKVRCHCNSENPPHEAIIRRALEIRADLVVVGTRVRGMVGRLLLRNTDWELIRQCPIPLLLIKSTRSYANSAILAAVDPFHTHAKPAALDARLLSLGSMLSRLFKSSLHIFHAYMPLTPIAPTPGAVGIAIGPGPEVEQAHADMVAAELGRVAKHARVPRAAQHLRMGVVANELLAVSRETRASIVVMGAVSRSRLRRIFIGSTAEDVLDKLRCDVLVVKPRGFKYR